MQRIFTLLLISLLCSCGQQHPNTKNIQAERPIVVYKDSAFNPHEWLMQHSDLDTTDSCMRKVLSMVRYLDTETLSRSYTFERYPVQDTFTGIPAPLDISSCKSAHYFRTAIGYQLKEQGVNFAGKYAIVSDGMTGSQDYYWIVDRTTGKAYEFPYIVDTLYFRKNSNLIIINSREQLLERSQSSNDLRELCDMRLWDLIPDVDKRPVYLLWSHNKLIILGQKKLIWPMLARDNNFWLNDSMKM